VLPGLISTLTFYVFRKFAPQQKQKLLVPISIQAGQLGWFLLGALSPGGVEQLGLDIAIFSAGLIWLYVRQTRAPAIMLIAYHSLAIAYHFYQATQFAISSPTSLKPLAVHIVWRAMAIFFLGKFLIERSSRTEEIAQVF
jgi:hypothetical protein